MNDDLPLDEMLFEEVRDALQNSADPEPVVQWSNLPPIEGYEIVRELHRGGQGIVYEARQHQPARRVALKVLLRGRFSSERQRYRFEREVQLIATLNHPNIVTIFDSGTFEGQLFYVMEFVDGKALHRDERYALPVAGNAAQMRRHTLSCLTLIETICGAVTCFQQRGLIHRDLKPDNILLGDDGRPYVIDFGLARQSENGGGGSSRLQTQDGEFLGTLAYASPEQISGNPDAVDSRSDVYALGVIMYELLTGQLPHRCDDSVVVVVQRIANDDAIPPSRLNARIDRDVETIVMKAINRDPERRYQSATLLAADINQYLGGRPIDARRDSPGYVLRKTIRRHWLGLTFAVIFVICLAASSLISFRLWQDAEREMTRAQQAELSEREARQEEALQREEAEFRGAVASLAAAQGATQNNQIQDAYDHLFRVPEHWREFEWRYALSQIDSSIDTWNAIQGMSNLSVSADGSLFAVSGRNGQIQIVEMDSRNVVLQLSDAGAVTALEFHPNNEVAVIGLADGTLRQLHVGDGAWQPTRRPVNGTVNNIAISGDGNRLVVSSGVADSGKYEFSIRDFTSDDVIVSDNVWTQAIDIDNVGRRVLTSGDELTVRDLETGAIQNSVPIERCQHAKFGSHGSEIFAAAFDRMIHIFDAADLQEKSRFACQAARTRGLAVDSAGSLIVTAAADGTLRSWDSRDGKPIRVFRGHLGWVHGVHFTSDRQQLFSLDQQSSVKFWHASTDVADYREFIGDTVFDVGFNSSGETAVVSTSAGKIELRDVASGRRLRTYRAHTAAVNAAAFSPVGNLVASASADKTVHIWDVEARDPQILTGHTDNVLCTAFSPDGKSVASGGEDGTIRIWDSATGTEQAVLTSDVDAAVRWVQFLPEGNRLAAERPESLEIWGVSEDKLERRWSVPLNTWYSTAALHPDGSLIAVGDDSGRISLWNVDTGEMESLIEFHAMALTALAFNANGTRLVAASMDGAIKIWHVERRVELLSLPTANSLVHSLQFSPDGSRIAAGLHEGTILFWEAIALRDRLRIGSAPSGTSR